MEYLLKETASTYEVTFTDIVGNRYPVSVLISNNDAKSSKYDTLLRASIDAVYMVALDRDDKVVKFINSKKEEFIVVEYQSWEPWYQDMIEAIIPKAHNFLTQGSATFLIHALFAVMFKEY